MLLVLSSLFGAPGGIPAFNRLLVRAALEYTAGEDERLGVVALTDVDADAHSEGRLPMSFGETWGDRLRGSLPADWYRPCGGDRLRCVAELLRALPLHRRILFGHVNLAPLGLLLRLASSYGYVYGVITHGTEVWARLPWHRRLALRAAHSVACVSEDTAARVADLQGVERRRCFRIINAIESLPPAPEQTRTGEPAGPPPPLSVLSVTRLHPGEPKGVDLVLRALAGLPPATATYTVVGEGAARPRLTALAAELGLDDRVRLTGALSDAERDLAFFSCDVMALPSQSEGFGIAYLEAMAHGKPCLAARAGGAPEVVLHGETGLVVEPTVEAVRAALLQLCDAGLRQRLGAAGRARVASHFTYDSFRTRAFALFDRLGQP